MEIDERTGFWDDWAKAAGTKYPSERVVQFALRTFPVDKRRSSKVLDICCGSGSNCRFFAREGFDVTGTDLSPVAVGQAKQRFASDGLTGSFLVNRADRQPFPDASFDLVTCIRALEYIREPAEQDAVVAECSRLLKPVGRGMFIIPSRLHFGFLDPTFTSSVPFFPQEDEATFGMFSKDRFSSVNIDRETITRENGLHKEDHHIITFRR